LGNKLLPYVLLLPAVALLLAVVAYPIARQLYTSLLTKSLMRPLDTRFIGLENYREILFEDQKFLKSLQRTAAWIGIVVSMQFALGFVLALLLNREFRFRGILRSLLLTPWFISGVTGALIWTWILDPNFGVLNDILHTRLHLAENPILWLSSPKAALPAAAFPAIWRGAPFFAITLLAALQGIPIELYDAAKIDGAGRWDCFRYVTFPCITPTIIITVMLRTIWVSNYVTYIWIMTGGGPGDHSTTLAVYIAKTFSQSMNVGYTSALAVCLGCLLAVIIALYLYYLRRSEERLS
jgi:multiple sugar transport system permease protein